MAMFVQELTQRYNKFTEKVIEFVTVATALAMMAFAAWQLWMQYFVTQGGGKQNMAPPLSVYVTITAIVAATATFTIFWMIPYYTTTEAEHQLNMR